MTPRRLVLRVLLGLLVAASLAGGAWYGWHWHTRPLPPSVDLEGADAAVVSAVDAALTRVKREPYTLAAWDDLGKLLRASDYRAEAAACFAVAERLDPAEPRWPYLRGEALATNGDAEAALAPLRRAAALCVGPHADDVVPHLRLGEVLLAQGQIDEAEEQLSQAREADPSNPNVLLNLALVAFARDDLTTSRTLAERARRSPLTQRRACVHLAAVCQRLGDETAAADYSRRLASLPTDPAWPDPYVLECLQRAVGQAGRFRYVEGREAQGRLAEAVAVQREIAKEAPDARVFVGLARNLSQLGDHAGAEEAARSALSLVPDNVQALYLLSKSLWAQGEGAEARKEPDAARGRFEAAIVAARQALARKPDHALAHMLLGLSLKRLEKRDEAIAALRLAVQCAPELPDPHLHLGEALAEAGQVAEARTHLKHAFELARPDDPRPRAALERYNDR